MKLGLKARASKTLTQSRLSHKKSGLVPIQPKERNYQSPLLLVGVQAVGLDRFFFHDIEEHRHADVLADQTPGHVLETLLVVEVDVVAQELLRRGRFRKHD